MDDQIFIQHLSKAMRFCSRAEYCEFDVKKKLTTWKTPFEYHDQIIDRLKEENFLNHERYAEAYVKDKLRYNFWGRRKITYMLSSKKVESNHIDNALSQIDPEEYKEILSIQINQKFRSTKEQDEQKLKAKLFNFCASRGYESELSFQIINQILASIK